jgi:tetratricopeptide (TPR) repeat protein
MKKSYWNILLPVFFVLAVGFVVVKYRGSQQAKNEDSFTFLPRTGNNSNEEWFAAKKNADRLMAKLKSDPNDTRSALALANAYIMEARVSGYTAYYDKAAMKTVDKMLEKRPDNYEALMLRALVQLSQHHFAEALATAKLAESIDANSAFVFGLLVDANVEMGNYEAAVEAAEQMINIRPDLRSYSRIAYLREIHGDYRGAIEAMKLAVQAGVTAEESTEWCRVQLGRLYEHVGDIDQASFQYQLSLAARPAYPYALAGLGRIAAHEKKYDSAIHYYEQATALINDLGIKEELVKAYAYAGQNERSASLNKELINEMNRSAKELVVDPDAGHYSDKEMAYAYIQNKDYDQALKYAMEEYKRRPRNIEVNETMALVHYKRNEIEKALPYLNAALTTKSMNPVLLCTAGLIYAKAGDTEKAKRMLGLGLKHDAVMPADVKKESVEALQRGEGR